MNLRVRSLWATTSLAAFALSAGVGLWSAPAHAFCRTHTGDDPESTCPSTCTKVGLPLSWRHSDIRYVFNERGFPGVSDEKLRQVFADSFQAWEDIECGGVPVGFNVTVAPGTTTLETGPEKQELNDNVIVHYDAASWAAEDYSPHAFAVTAVWHSKKTGIIYGADIGFNGGMDLYGDCALDKCSNVGIRTDLQNVATHEIGHVLGLSHSDVKGSTMDCEAGAADTNKRTLEQDDINGICEAYPPGDSFPEDDEPGDGGASRRSKSARCSLQAESTSRSLDLSVFSALGALLVLRGRKRARR